MRRPVSASAFGPRGHRGSVGLLASGLAAAGPAVQAPYMIFAAVGLIGAAVVVQADTGHRPDLLSQIAFVGSALAMVGWVDLGAQPSDRVVLIGLVAAIAGLVAADLVGLRPSDWAINLIVSGCLGAGVGAALLISGHVPGVVFAGLGLTLVGIGVADMAGRRLPGWITQMGAGLMAVGVGVAELIGRQLPVGIAFICGGLAAVGYGALAFHRHHVRSPAQDRNRPER